MRFSTPAEYDSVSPGSVSVSAVAKFSRDIDSLVHAAPTWSEADQIIRSQLSESSSVPQPLREQNAAHAMFRNHFGALKNKTPSEKELNALGHYTTLLVDNRSPESWLVQNGASPPADNPNPSPPTLPLQAPRFFPLGDCVPSGTFRWHPLYRCSTLHVS
jgi:hypothetical protein